MLRFLVYEMCMIKDFVMRKKLGTEQAKSFFFVFPVCLGGDLYSFVHNMI
jgi:hypothetical protein